MRIKVLWVLALAVALAPAASADIIVNFSTPVTMVSFYSSEPFDLTATSNGASATNVTVNSGLSTGAVTSFSDTNVTQVVFSGTPQFYVLDDLKYMVGGNTYTIGFDDATIAFDYTPIGSFYSGMAGGPTFSVLAQILTLQRFDSNGFPVPNTGYSDFLYPYNSCNSGDPSICSVIYEGQFTPPPRVPEPGTLAMFGTGLMSLAGVVRRKWMA